MVPLTNQLNQSHCLERMAAPPPPGPPRAPGGFRAPMQPTPAWGAAPPPGMAAPPPPCAATLPAPFIATPNAWQQQAGYANPAVVPKRGSAWDLKLSGPFGACCCTRKVRLLVGAFRSGQGMPPKTQRQQHVKQPAAGKQAAAKDYLPPGTKLSDLEDEDLTTILTNIDADEFNGFVLRDVTAQEKLAA